MPGHRDAVGAERRLRVVRIIPFPQGAFQVSCHGSMKILRKIIRAGRDVRDHSPRSMWRCCRSSGRLRRYDFDEIAA